MKLYIYTAYNEMVREKEKSNSEMNWDETGPTIYGFLEFNFQFLILISVFHDTNFRPI